MRVPHDVLRRTELAVHGRGSEDLLERDRQRARWREDRSHSSFSTVNSEQGPRFLRGAATYYKATICRKLHEKEENWTEGRGVSKILLCRSASVIVDEFSLDLMSKLQSKGVDPMFSSDRGQCANHYTMEPSVTEITFKWILVCGSLLL